MRSSGLPKAVRESRKPEREEEMALTRRIAPVIATVAATVAVLLVASDAMAQSNTDPLAKLKPNVYGLGTGSDQYGRAFRHDPMLRDFQQDRYGLGVHSDQYGRALRLYETPRGRILSPRLPNRFGDDLLKDNDGEAW